MRRDRVRFYSRCAAVLAILLEAGLIYLYVEKVIGSAAIISASFALAAFTCTAAILHGNTRGD